MVFQLADSEQNSRALGRQKSREFERTLSRHQLDLVIQRLPASTKVLGCWLTRIVNNMAGHLELLHGDLAAPRKEEDVPVFIPHIDWCVLRE